MLDGAHPKIKEAAYALNPGAKEKSQATFITRKGGKRAKVSHRTTRITAVMKVKWPRFVNLGKSSGPNR